MVNYKTSKTKPKMKALGKHTVSVTEESFIFFQTKPKVMTTQVKALKNESIFFQSILYILDRKSETSWAKY